MVAVVRAMKTSKGWTDEDGQFIPEPFRWLKNKKWDCKLSDLKPEHKKTSAELLAAAEAEERENES